MLVWVAIMNCHANLNTNVLIDTKMNYQLGYTITTIQETLFRQLCTESPLIQNNFHLKSMKI